MAEFAKKGKKTAAPEVPRFGRVRSNLKVSGNFLMKHECEIMLMLPFYVYYCVDGYSWLTKRW